MLDKQNLSGIIYQAAVVLLDETDSDCIPATESSSVEMVSTNPSGSRLSALSHAAKGMPFSTGICWQ